jgi:hypothetical protein
VNTILSFPCTKHGSPRASGLHNCRILVPQTGLRLAASIFLQPPRSVHNIARYEDIAICSSNRISVPSNAHRSGANSVGPPKPSESDEQVRGRNIRDCTGEKSGRSIKEQIFS